jgi:homoserine kinase type II
MELKTINVLIGKFSELKSGITASEKMDKGYLSENFVITSGGNKYFLKCYRFRERDRIDDAHKAKFFFASKGIPVILPIENIEGDTVTQIEDKYVSLFPFVIGMQFITKDSMIPADVPRHLGAMLGSIHKASESGYPEINQKFEPWNKENFYRSADAILDIINNKKELTDFDRKAKEAIEFKKGRVKEEWLLFEKMKDLRTGLIHGDYHDGNVFFDEAGNITHVFDLEKACIAPYVFEIVRAVQYSRCTEYNREGSEKHVAEFLRGYREERSVSSDELNQGIELFYQREIHGLWVEKEHYLKNNFRVSELLHTKAFLQSLSDLRGREL